MSAGTFSQGVGGRNGTAAIPLSQEGAGPEFTKLNLQATLTQPLPAGFQFMLIGRLQSSFNQPLMLAEQFSLDGSDALSGFASGTFSVDQGATVRAELARPFAVPIPAPASPLIVAPYVFGAFGRGEIVQPTAVQQKDIDAGSAGVGARTDASIVGGPIGGSFAMEAAAKFADVPGDGRGYRVNVSFNLRF